MPGGPLEQEVRDASVLEAAFTVSWSRCDGAMWTPTRGQCGCLVGWHNSAGTDGRETMSAAGFRTIALPELIVDDLVDPCEELRRRMGTAG